MNIMDKLILKLDAPFSAKTSNEGVLINKIFSSISPRQFIKLISEADNKVNPRTAKEGSITKAIQETLSVSPELFWYKTKGILLCTEDLKLLDRNRIQISLSNIDYEGIMDGGHNSLGIAMHLLKNLLNIKVKNWNECKKIWHERFDEILQKFDQRESEFLFSIPIEIIYPNSDDIVALDQYYDHIAEICSARNNNVQLTETSKGNKVGYYDYLKEVLGDDFNVIWKAGEKGDIRSEDIISLATIPLTVLSEKNLLPKEISKLSPISIYSQKSKCIDFFNSVIDHKLISEEINGRHRLTDVKVKSAIDMIGDVLRFYDQLYIKFPKMYNKVSPGFGRIRSVKQKEQKPLFNSTTETCPYSYPPAFIYPLVSGLTSLIKINEEGLLSWKINPMNINLDNLDIDIYVDQIKLVDYDAQRVGKSEVFYKQSKSIYDNYLIKAQPTLF